MGIKRAAVFVAAGRPAVGKGRAIGGLVMGAVGLVATVIMKGFLF